MSETEKTHYRKAFNSPYLSSADIVELTRLTVSKVMLQPDKTNKTKDNFNTAYFTQKEIRPGEELKPMILNATNSKIMAQLTGSKFIDDWINIDINIFVDEYVRFGRDTVEGLRISPIPPVKQKPALTPDKKPSWDRAIQVYLKQGNLDRVKAAMTITPELEKRLIEESGNVS